MAQDHHVEPSVRPDGHGRLIAAGVIGACALGVGLGLWARPTVDGPAMIATAPKPKAPAPPPRLQIVIDDAPAPIGRPMEVLPPNTARPMPGQIQPEPPPEIAPAEPVAPRRPPSGLMRVDAPVAAAVAAVPLVVAPPRAEPQEEPAPKPKAEKAAKAEPAPKAEPKPARKPGAKVARADRPAAKAASHQPARAEPGKAALAKSDKPRQAKPTPEARKLAEAEPAPPKKTHAEPSRRLANLVAAGKNAPKKLKAEAPPKKTVELAEARRPKAVKKLPVEKAATPPAAKPKAKPPAPVPRGEGPMRVAKNNGCVSPDPAEALVCADTRLASRERQLQRAYRDAEAAGVPASALRRQQVRWLQARAAAAREAPWAVEDVYEARIAELNDQTRDARAN